MIPDKNGTLWVTFMYKQINKFLLYSLIKSIKL